MTYTLAKTAGFCFGVNRAVEMVYKLVGEGKRAATLGPIIHNPQMVEELAAKGVRIINDPAEALPGETVVIRSHGVGPQVYDTLKANGTDYIDATCPFVAKIHRIAKKAAAEGKTVLITGAARGIGASCAELFAKNGWKITVRKAYI